MNKFFICTGGGNSIPENFSDTIGVVGELYWCTGDEYIRSPEDCRGREDAEVIYLGLPEDSNDSHRRNDDNLALRKITIDTSSFTEISRDEYQRLAELKKQIREAQETYSTAVAKYFR